MQRNESDLRVTVGSVNSKEEDETKGRKVSENGQMLNSVFVADKGTQKEMSVCCQLDPTYHNQRGNGDENGEESGLTN